MGRVSPGVVWSQPAQAWGQHPGQTLPPGQAECSFGRVDGSSQLHAARFLSLIPGKLYTGLSNNSSGTQVPEVPGGQQEEEEEKTRVGCWGEQGPAHRWVHGACGCPHSER